MPDELKALLEGLADDVASRVCEWLDENPMAPNEMIEVVAKSHPAIQSGFVLPS